jgi:hypothetical protein
MGVVADVLVGGLEFFVGDEFRSLEKKENIHSGNDLKAFPKGRKTNSSGSGAI